MRDGDSIAHLEDVVSENAVLGAVYQASHFVSSS
jgi:hypothetical protein